MACFKLASLLLTAFVIIAVAVTTTTTSSSAKDDDSSSSGDFCRNGGRLIGIDLGTTYYCREDLVRRAMSARKAKRYDDMAAAMKAVVTETGVELSNEERKLLTVAYKNWYEAIVSLWRGLHSSATPSPSTQRFTLKQEIKVREICYEVIGLLDKFLIPRASTNAESMVFYLTMKGDYYRYLEEVATEDTMNTVVEASRKAYEEAFEISISKMARTHPIRLELVLSISFFYNEILDSPEKACRIVKGAFDEAMAELDTLNMDSYKEFVRIMQILLAELTLCTIETQNSDGEDVVQPIITKLYHQQSGVAPPPPPGGGAGGDDDSAGGDKDEL